MIRHVFMWRVAEGSDPDEVFRLLNTLSDRLSNYMARWECGQHEGEPNDNGQPWAGVLITDFRNWDDMQAYTDDPFHLEVVEKLKPMVSDRAVVDFSVEEAS